MAIQEKIRNGTLIKVIFPLGEEITYPSIAEAARQIGINRQEIFRYIRGEYKKNRKGYKFIPIIGE